MQDSCEEHDFDADYYFRYQLFEHEPELNDIKPSVIVGRICEQSPRFDTSKTSSEWCCLNKRVKCNYKYLNEDLTLFNGDNQVDLINVKE